MSSIRERLVEDANRGSSRCVRLSFLVDFSVQLQNSDRNRSYVEVILKGKEEGQFLEDSTAPHNEMLKGVLKLGRFWRCYDQSKKLTTPLIGIFSLLDPYRHRS